MHVGVLDVVLGILKIPAIWALSLLTFLVTLVIGFFQSSNLSTGIWLGIISAVVGLVSAVSVKLIDVYLKRREERRKDKEKEEETDIQKEARLALESANLRQEERDFFNSVISRMGVEKQIASRRGHALGGEVDRLRNNLLICVEALGGKIPVGVMIFNPELHKYLAELEELPLPELAPRPNSLQDIHRTSSPALPRIE